MTLTQYLSQRGFVGVGAEATVGTPVAATGYLQLLEESLARAPGIILEKLLRQSRDVAYVPVLGEQKIGGKIDTPLYVDQGLLLLTAAVGSDLFQTGGASSGSVALNANAAAGASSLAITTQTSPALAANDYVELRQASGQATTANLSEVHKVASVSGAGPFTITLLGGEALRNSYTSVTAQVYRVAAGSAVFTHSLQADQPNAGAYKTLTLEKNLGGLTSLQWAGSIVSKASFTFTTRDAAKVSYEVKALAEAQITGSTPSFGNSAPLAMANLTVQLFGANDLGVVSFDLDVDQGGKEFWTFNGGNLPSLVVPVERKVTGKFTCLVQSMAYYNDMAAGTTGAFSLTETQGSSSMQVSLPRCVITRLGVPLKVGDLLLFDADFQAVYSDSAGQSVQFQVVNGQWLPFI